MSQMSSYDHLARLLVALRALVSKDRDRVLVARQIYIAMGVLFVWARDIDHLDAIGRMYICPEQQATDTCPWTTMARSATSSHAKMSFVADIGSSAIAMPFESSRLQCLGSSFAAGGPRQ